MPAAWDTCFGNNANATRRQDNGWAAWLQNYCNSQVAAGRQDNGCPSFDDIMSMVGEEFMEQSCVLEQIGWIDAYGNEMQDVIEADISTLAQEVQKGLSEEGHAQCVGDTLAEMEEKYGSCADNYSRQEENDTLLEVAYKIASYKCFMRMFMEACDSYVKP